MSFYGVTDLCTYVFGAFDIILLSGPHSLFVLLVATVRGVMTLSALYLSALIFADARLAKIFRARKHLTSSLSSAVGGLFVWFGVKLATASLG